MSNQRISVVSGGVFLFVICLIVVTGRFCFLNISSEKSANQKKEGQLICIELMEKYRNIDAYWKPGSELTIEVYGVLAAKQQMEILNYLVNLKEKKSITSSIILVFYEAETWKEVGENHYILDTKIIKSFTLKR